MRVFRPTRGLVVGAIGAAAAVVAGVLFVVNAWSTSAVEVCLGLWMFAWLIWVVLMRPTVRLAERDVYVGGGLRTTRLPAERIESVSMRQYLEIDADGRTFTCAAIGHTRRDMRAARQGPLRGLVVDEAGRSSVSSQGERLRELLEEMASAARRRPRAELPVISTAWDRLPVLIGLGLVLALAVAVVVGVAT